MLIADGELHFGPGRRTKIEEEAQGILALLSHLPNSEWRQYRTKEGADITDPTVYERYSQRWNSTLSTFDRVSEATGTGMTVRSMRTFVGSGLVKTLSQGAESWAIAQTVASAAGAVLNALVVPAATITISGSTGITTATGFNAVSLGRPTLSAASAVAITNAATLYVSNSPVGAGDGPATITNPYAIWVDDGVVRFDAGFTLTGPIDIASGTAAAPAYTFTGDLDTGVYRPGANRLGFATAGLLAAELDAVGLLVAYRGVSGLVPSATAAAQTVNGLNASALDITSAAASAYTGTVAQLRTPGLVAGDAADTGAIAFTALNISARAFTNPGVATALIPTVKGIVISGPAGQANLTGVYTYSGIEITTPNQAANGVANVATGLLITTGASDGTAPTQTGISITGGAQTAGTQRGLYINMADAAHVAFRVDQGTSTFDDLVTISSRLIINAGQPATGLYALSVVSTLPAVNGAQVGVSFDITSSAFTGGQIAQNLNLQAGFVGGTMSKALGANNYAAGVGADLAAWTFNCGIDSAATGVTGVGYNVGVAGVASGAIKNVGLYGYAQANVAGAKNIGVLGLGYNANGGGGTFYAGGVFGLSVTNVTLDENAALIADNGAIAASIFLARDNGSNVVTIADGGILTTFVGKSALLLSASAAAQTVNPADASALDITSVLANAYTGTVSQVRLPGLIAAAAGSVITLTGINLSQRALTDPGAGVAQALTVTQIAIAGAAGVANITGAYTWRGVNLTTPSFAANAAANYAAALDVTLGTADGSAATTQVGLIIAGGTQTAGAQYGIYIDMAATTHDAIRTIKGRTRLGGDLFVRGGNTPIVARTYTTDATVGPRVYTAAEVYGGVMLRDPAGGDRADTLPTAADLVAGIPNAAVGDTFEFVLVNTADAVETITLSAGASGTLVPASVTPTQNEVTRLLIRLTNVTGGAQAYTAYSMTAGA